MAAIYTAPLTRFPRGLKIHGLNLNIECNAELSKRAGDARPTNRRPGTITSSTSRKMLEQNTVCQAATEVRSELDPDPNADLRQGIADFYDASSEVWEEIWGEHMHHGFYDVSAQDVSLCDHRAAQMRMIEETLSFAAVPGEDESKRPKSIVDVGCGIGGSSRYLATKYGATVKGITLSPLQAARANALTAAASLSNKVEFQVADALNQPFPDGQFDLVWSMESGEHMPDKEKFMKELVRVAAPGGFIIIVTWCHRDLLPGEVSLKPSEQELLDKICKAYYLPAWCSPSDYVKLAQASSLQDIKTADWSDNVAPFWPAVIRSAFSWRAIAGVLRSGWKTLKGAFAMTLMVKGYKQGLIKFAVITARKPA
uniref:Methyltransferase type 11 domain-containing protein n=1 Tax=Araucaria cunninghamii TaxID=56994 RepID=A0A0D6QZ18_ARACU